MCQRPIDPAHRRFQRKCQLAVGASLIVGVLCSQASTRLHLAPAAGLVVAALAGAAFFTELVSVGLLTLRLRDEFQRALLTRSFIWATLVTMAVATVWGFVGMRSGSNLPRLDVIWIPVILISVTAVAKLLIFRQHRPLDD